MSAILNPLPPPAPVRRAPEVTPELPSPPSRRRWWLAAVGVLLAIGGLFAWNSRRPEAQQASVVPIRTAKVTSGSLDQAIRVAGQTSAREYATIIAPRLVGPESNRPLVLLKLAKSGVMVRKGDLLAQIDGQSLQDHIDDVHATVVQSEADMQNRLAEQAIERENLQQNYRVAEAELQKQRLEARAMEVRTPIDRELSKLSIEEAEATVNELATEIKLKQVSHASEIRILDYTRERHTRHRDRHKKDVLRFTILASMDGLAVVQSIFRGGEFVALGEGDQVYPGQIIAKVVNPRSMQVETAVNQAEIGNFRVGQTAKVTFDAFPGLELPAKIYSIGAIAISGFRQQAYMRTIPVRVDILGFDARVIPDLSAGADVLIARTDNVNKLPLGAVRVEYGKNIAYVKQDGRFVKRELRLGTRNDIEVAAMGGVTAGDEVALNYEVAAAK